MCSLHLFKKMTFIAPAIICSLLGIGTLPSFAEAVSIIWMEPTFFFHDQAMTKPLTISHNSHSHITDTFGRTANYRQVLRTPEMKEQQIRINKLSVTLANHSPTDTTLFIPNYWRLTPLGFTCDNIDAITLDTDTQYMHGSCNVFANCRSKSGRVAICKLFEWMSYSYNL